MTSSGLTYAASIWDIAKAAWSAERKAHVYCLEMMRTQWVIKFRTLMPWLLERRPTRETWCAPLKLLFDRNVPVFMGESPKGMPVPRQKGTRARDRDGMHDTVTFQLHCWRAVCRTTGWAVAKKLIGPSGRGDLSGQKTKACTACQQRHPTCNLTRTGLSRHEYVPNGNFPLLVQEVETPGPEAAHEPAAIPAYREAMDPGTHCTASIS